MVLLDVVAGPLDFLYATEVQVILIPVAVVAVAAVTAILFVFGGRKK